jgi:predicted DNA-binding transcriptional regulator AlpA
VVERRRPKLFQDEQLYSVNDIAKKMGGKTHPLSVWRWVREGRIGTPLKIGPKTTRFLGSELNEKLFG